MSPKSDNACEIVPGKFWCQAKKCKEIIEQAILDKEDRAVSWFCPSCGHTSSVNLKKGKGY